MFASVTRLRVRSIGFLPEFLLRTLLTQRQATRAAGFVGGRLLVDSGHTYWTLTVWESEQAMKKFRGSGQHGTVMRKLPQWCNEAAYAHWTTESTDVPTWPEAYDHLVADGKLSRVDQPTPEHEKREFRLPRLKPEIGSLLKARSK
jgi:heme-degrading monooxygenase HmoA